MGNREYSSGQLPGNPGLEARPCQEERALAAQTCQGNAERDARGLERLAARLEESQSEELKNDDHRNPPPPLAGYTPRSTNGTRTPNTISPLYNAAAAHHLRYGRCNRIRVWFERLRVNSSRRCGIYLPGQIDDERGDLERHLLVFRQRARRVGLHHFQAIVPR